MTSLKAFSIVSPMNLRSTDTLHNLGVDIKELRAVGGGAKSPVWLQVKADILGVPVASLAIRELHVWERLSWLA